jgi:putative colanic acid biosynthesis acetyltransferase WcaF
MESEKKTKIIPLKDAPGARESWKRPAVVIGLWIIAEFLFVTNPMQLSSRVRGFVLSCFGAKIGHGVTLRPRLRVKFPWNLTVGDNCWIGEGVWIHNQDKVVIGNDVCISQETFITTGSHEFRTDMALVTKPVTINSGVWVCSRAIVTAGTHIGTSALIPAGAVVKGYVGEGEIFPSGRRFSD